MNKLQKERIELLRAEGQSYTRIADILCVSENTVKSFCRRNNLSGTTNNNLKDRCRGCGSSLIQTKGAKQKHFCSDLCRMKWWNAHPEEVNRKAIYKLTCMLCGVEFESYGNKGRKYCSRACSGAARMTSHE